MSERCPNCRSDDLTASKRCLVCGSKKYVLLAVIPVGWLYEHEYKQLLINFYIFMLVAFLIVLGFVVPALIINA